MKKPLAFPVLLSLMAVSSLISNCATVVDEINGPTVETKLHYPSNNSVVRVSGRNGATQQFLAIRPENIKASLVLFAGGTGDIGLSQSGSFRRGGNFLVKTRNKFAQQDMLVAVVDTPSDRSSLDHFRTSKAHAIDIRSVINWLRKTADVPVWLVGTSRGTIPAAGVAGQLTTGGPDGIVLTSTVFGPSKRGTIYGANLKAIKVPILVVHHQNDSCSVTAYSGTTRFMKSILGASKSELIPIRGGIGNMGNSCGPKGHHGYLGQENMVVKLIADWIKAN